MKSNVTFEVFAANKLPEISTSSKLLDHLKNLLRAVLVGKLPLLSLRHKALNEAGRIIVEVIHLL
jgi:hypothetical protein